MRGQRLRAPVDPARVRSITALMKLFPIDARRRTHRGARPIEQCSRAMQIAASALPIRSLP